MEPLLDATLRGDRLELVASGPWTSAHVAALERLTEAAAENTAAARRVVVDMAGVAALDTLGAWLIERLLRGAAARGRAADLTRLPERYQGLFEELRRVNRRPPASRPRLHSLLAGLDTLGRAVVGVKDEFAPFLDMFGAMAVALARVIMHPARLRLTSAVHH